MELGQTQSQAGQVQFRNGRIVLMKASLALGAITIFLSLSAQAQDSQFFFQARKNQFFLTPFFVASHEDYSRGPTTALANESLRRDYGMNFYAEYGVSDSISVEGGIGAAYNSYTANVLSTYHKKISYFGANAASFRLKGRADGANVSFRYGLDVRIALDNEPERALWDWGTTVSPYLGLQTPYDNGVVGVMVLIDAVHSARQYVTGFEPVTTPGAGSINLTSSTVEGGQRVRAVLFAEGDDRNFDVGVGLGIEHHFSSTISSLANNINGANFRFVENNIFLRGYFVYEFLPKVNIVLDATGIIGEREKIPGYEDFRRNQFVAMAGVRMEL
jgi:hypothetical protein